MHNIFNYLNLVWFPRIFIFFAFLISFTFRTENLTAQHYALSSPDKNLNSEIKITPDGSITYSLTFKDRKVLNPGSLGLNLKNQPDFSNGFLAVSEEKSSQNNSWEPVWGEESTIINHYNQLELSLSHAQTDRVIHLQFRLFDDGLAFRYHFPRQSNLSYFTIADELTTFNLTENLTAFWIPGDYDTNEYPYFTTKLSEIDATRAQQFSEIGVKNIVGENVVQTPLTMIGGDKDLFISIHEAALKGYPAMYADVDRSTFSVKAELAHDKNGNKAYLQTPFTTPWRVILVTEQPEDLLASRTILNLNEPSKIEDTDWIKPQKYVGIWWEMHAAGKSWNYADVSNIKLDQVDWDTLKTNGRHGATTKRAKKYIDFAADHGFESVLIEGWNVGWEDWYGNGKEEVFDFVTPYPDFDVKKVTAYAKKKGVKVMMHHETSGSVTNFERRMDEAYDFMDNYGYESVKTGYVGGIIPRSEYHDSQWMVDHFIRVAEKTAERNILLNSHESTRPTGLHRTWPNWLASESARGNEFNAWSSGNPPEHETILPFTRILGGPMDYTPGIFQIKLDYYNSESPWQVKTTLAKQLALYVTIYSPLQMAADLPENYERFPDAFQFIKDVPVDWSDSRYLDAFPGDYIAIARKDKHSDNWFIGAITDEKARNFDLNLDFLEKNSTYEAIIYRDSKDAHWKDNPMSYEIKELQEITSQSNLQLNLKPGGGAAVMLKKVK